MAYMPSNLLEFAETKENFLNNIINGGSTVMALKLRTSHHIGNILPCHNQEKHAKCAAKPEMLTVFLNHKGSVYHEYA
jgi:hypothetical protein